MKHILFILSILLTSFFVKAQEKVINAVVPAPGVPITTADGKKIFTSVTVDPVFPGGMSKFYMYLSNNIQYPENAHKNHIQGKVFLSFIVEEDGSLSNVKVVRGV